MGVEVVVVGCEKEPEREVIVASPSEELKQKKYFVNYFHFLSVWRF